MDNAYRQFGLRKAAVALALLAAFGAAQAQDSEVTASVSAGVGGVSGDKQERSWFGQYNGLRDRDFYGLLDFDYHRYNAATGTSAGLIGSRLGLDTRELNLWWKRQGNWKITADYGELVRREPYSINTALIGGGSDSPQVLRLATAGSGSALDLKTKRRGIGVGLSKWLTPGLEFSASFNSENKEGARLFGIGFSCPSTAAPGCGPTTGINAGSAVLLLPEPIDSNHSQIEARLNYTAGRLALTGGYYGSLYNNSLGTLRPNVPASLSGPLGNSLLLANGLQSILSQPVALPPDNQAHQFDLGGSYAFTPTMRGSFKLAYTRGTQDQDFVGTGLAGAPAGVLNLDGKVNTTLGQLAFSARPLPQLSLNAQWRFEDKDDKTPLALYNTEGTSSYTNRNFSRKRYSAKVEGAYRFLGSYIATVGVDYDFIDRQQFAPTSAVSGISALRYETEEIGYRVELRRRMTETISGAISYLSSDRDGSSWLRPNSGLGVTRVDDPATGFDSTAIFSPTLADRKRDKIKVLAMWQPTDALSLQLSAEDGKDKFSAPTVYAVRRSDLEFYNLDVGYVVADGWNLNAYASRGKQGLDQARPGGYVLDYNNTSTTVGLGLTGKAGEKISFGGNVDYLNDKSVYAQALDVTATASNAALLAAAGGLPDITFRSTVVKLYGKYALAQRSSLRLDVLYQRARFNDWAYDYNGVPFTFSDNTTLTWRRTQEAAFFGVTYVYAWQ